MEYSFIQGRKYLWKIPQLPQETVNQVAYTHNMSLPLASVLVSRGYCSQDQIQEFLFISTNLNQDTSLMKGATIAVERILKAIHNKEKILIFGDYDVDGITSSSLMLMGLLDIGAQVNFYLPNRAKEGYGLSTKVVEKAAASNYKVIITVDNGITAFKPVDRANELGIDVIITDHHQPHDHVPNAYVIVDPHQKDCQYPFKYFAGVGVAFKILQLLYAQSGKEISPKVIELLLLGTVADVVPMLGENRFWVRKGLALVNSQESLALSVLKENSNVVKPELSSTDVGFSITPQINALGRLDDPRQGVEFLIGTNEDQVRRIGKVLHELNQARKDIEADMVLQIVKLVEKKEIDIEKENIIMVGNQDWPTGVIGLVASRIVGLYGKPTILFHLTKDGKAKGSCRSIQEFNMFDALCENASLLDSFGGHDVAAGLSLSAENLPILKENLEKRIKEKLTEFDMKQKVSVDACAQLSDFNAMFIEHLAHFEPFGSKNPVPTFYIKNAVLVQKPKLLKDAHVKCVLFADGVIKHAMFFKRPELYQLLIDQADKPFDMVAQVMHNYWNGNYTIELQGIDIAFSKEDA